MQWNKIDTAPRDGTVILVAESFYRDRVDLDFEMSPWRERWPRIEDPATWSGRIPKNQRDVIAVRWDGEGWEEPVSGKRMITFEPDVWAAIDDDETAGAWRPISNPEADFGDSWDCVLVKQSASASPPTAAIWMGHSWLRGDDGSPVKWAIAGGGAYLSDQQFRPDLWQPIVIPGRVEGWPA